MCPGGSTYADLRLLIRLRFVQRAKYESTQSSLVVIANHLFPQDQGQRRPSCLPGTTGLKNAVDPIAVILVYALRNGLVVANTLEEILEPLRQGSQLDVQWIHPNSPVICAANKSILDLDRAGTTQHIIDNLRNIAQLSKIEGSQSLTSSSLAKGAARDVAQLSKPLTGQVSKTVATALGHSHDSFLKGTTGDYAGHTTLSVFGRRAASEFRDPLAPQIQELAPQIQEVRLQPSAPSHCLPHLIPRLSKSQEVRLSMIKLLGQFSQPIRVIHTVPIEEKSANPRTSTQSVSVWDLIPNFIRTESVSPRFLPPDGENLN